MDTDFTTSSGADRTGGPHPEFPSRTARLRDGEFDLARQFIERLAAQGPSGGVDGLPDDLLQGLQGLDWDAIERAADAADSRERSIGRAIVEASHLTHQDHLRPRLVTDTPAGSASAPAPAPAPAPDGFFSYDATASVADFGDADRLRLTTRRFVQTHRSGLSFALSMLLILAIAVYAVAPNIGQSLPTAFNSPGAKGVVGNAQLATPPAGPSSAPATGNAEPAGPGAAAAAAVSLPAATAPPAPAPPSLAGAAPLRSHEVFGFAPYWTLSQSAGFNVSQLTTIAYFSIGVNPDGSLNESGPGWNGYQSQALASLVTRAHAAGDRVVLTVNCFDQHTLDQLTSSPSAPATLSTALLGAIKAKNLDGVNIDFEGQGSSDQAGLTNLVSSVSSALHAANPGYQVTMDTYASSAGDSSGFYNIAALAPVVDGFFVMDYELNLQSTASTTSPLTSSMFSESTTVTQYAAAVPPAKVILGLPYFGIDWPTTDGTLTAQATGPATPLSYSQIVSGGHPVYWDSTTDTAWTSYQAGTQWHEAFFEDPRALYDAAQLATAQNLGGVGIWALGMDGNDPNMLSALMGFSPVVKDSNPGPSTTSVSPTTTTLPSSAAGSTGSATTPSTTSSPSSTSTTTSPSSTSTTLPPPSGGGSPAVAPATGYSYEGTWDGQRVTLTPLSYANPSVGVAAGVLTAFSSSYPSEMCLELSQGLTVREVAGTPNVYYVFAQSPGSCVTAYFTFSVP